MTVAMSFGVQTWGLLLGWQQGSKMRKSHQGINCAYFGIGRHFMRGKTLRESLIRYSFLLLKPALEHRAWVCSKMGFPPLRSSGHRQWTSCWGSASGKQTARESPGEWPLPVGTGSRKEERGAGHTLLFIPNHFFFFKLFTPDVNSWHIGKDPDAGKDWRQKEKSAAEDAIVG